MTTAATIRAKDLTPGVKFVINNTSCNVIRIEKRRIVYNTKHGNPRYFGRRSQELLRLTHNP